MPALMGRHVFYRNIVYVDRKFIKNKKLGVRIWHRIKRVLLLWERARKAR